MATTTSDTMHLGRVQLLCCADTMKCPQHPLGAFFYSLFVGIGIMCVFIFFFILFLQWLGSAEAAPVEVHDQYYRGVPYNYTRYPHIERELRAIRQEVTPDSKCNACILEKYYSTTPQQRLEQLRDTIDKYYGNTKEIQP